MKLTNQCTIDSKTYLPTQEELGILRRLFSFLRSWKPRTINKTRAVRLRTHRTSTNRNWVKSKSRQDRGLWHKLNTYMEFTFVIKHKYILVELSFSKKVDKMWAGSQRFSFLFCKIEKKNHRSPLESAYLLKSTANLAWFAIIPYESRKSRQPLNSRNEVNSDAKSESI